MLSDIGSKVKAVSEAVEQVLEFEETGESVAGNVNMNG